MVGLWFRQLVFPRGSERIGSPHVNARTIATSASNIRGQRSYGSDYVTPTYYKLGNESMLVVVMAAVKVANHEMQIYSEELKADALWEANSKVLKLDYMTDGEIGELFERIDVDHSGFVSEDELRKALGLKLTFFMLIKHSMIEAIDADNNGLIDKKEFKALVHRIQRHHHTESMQKAAPPAEETEQKILERLLLKSQPLFYKTLRKDFAIFCLKKLYEVLLRQIAPSKIFDRLSKNPVKSAQRKMVKFNQRRLVAYKMLHTSLWSNALFVTSQFTYDVISALVEFIKSSPDKASDKNNTLQLVRRRARKAITWTARRLAYYSIMLVGVSSGFSVGYYISPEYGTHLGTFLGDTVANALATDLLGLSLS